MYRASSPYQPPPHENLYHPRPYSPAPAAPIVPGSVTYTTSIGSDGRTIYHPFKAVAASYQTAGGVVSGIQWVPAEATQILPLGAQPATAEFAASWGRGQLGKEDGRMLNDWGRDEEKRRRKEEKEVKRDTDLRKARERDVQANMARERRKSFNSNTPGSGYAFPAAGSSVYPPNQYSNYGERPAVPGAAPSYAASSGGAYSRDRKYSYSDMDRQFTDLDLDRRDRDRNRDRDYPGERERRLSRPSKYTPSEAGGDRPRAISGSLGPRPDAYDASGAYGPSGPYNSSMRAYSGGSGPPHASPNMRAASPNLRGGDAPYVPPGAGYPGSDYSSSPIPRPLSTSIGRSTTPFGGGAPPGAYPRSRPSSPMPGGPVGPAAPAKPYSAGSVAFPQVSPSMPVPGSVPGERAPVQQLAAPEGFSRPVNAANTFPPFDIIKVQDMDKFWHELPRMPPVLKPHDVFEADWNRLMQDIALAWAGKLPVLEYSPSGQQPKRSALIKELVDLWNAAFFHIRGAELVLYKGKERRSGPHAGMVDKDLPYLDERDDYISSSSYESEETDDTDSDSPVNRYHNVYGQRNTQQPLASVFEAGRIRKEAKLAAKLERKKKRREKHRRRREKYRQRKYSLYLTCLSGGTTNSQTSHMNPGIPYPAVGPAYGMRSGVTGGYSPGGY